MIQYGIALIEFFILFMDVFMCLVQLVYFFSYARVFLSSLV